jgi:hypothetical protein
MLAGVVGIETGVRGFNKFTLCAFSEKKPKKTVVKTVMNNFFIFDNLRFRQ